MSKDTATGPEVLPLLAEAPEQPPLPYGNGLTPRVLAAIDLMVFEGEKRREAAEGAGLTDEALRQALKKTQVLKHYRDQLEVLRESLRARALQRIGELSDKSGSEKVGLDAAKYLDSSGKSDRAHLNVGVQVNVAPGYMVDVAGQTQQAQQIAQQAGSSANCLQSNDDVLTDDCERDPLRP